MRHAKRSVLTTEDVNNTLRLRNVQVFAPLRPLCLLSLTKLQCNDEENSRNFFSQADRSLDLIAMSRFAEALPGCAAAVRLFEQGPGALPARGRPRGPLLCPGPPAQL